MKPPPGAVWIAKKTCQLITIETEAEWTELTVFFYFTSGFDPKDGMRLSDKVVTGGRGFQTPPKLGGLMV